MSKKISDRVKENLRVINNNNIDKVLWGRILNRELAIEMVKKSSEGFGHTEDLVSISHFFEYIKKNISYYHCKSIIDDWDNVSAEEQVSLSFEVFGEKYASLFMILVDTIIESREK